MFNLNYKWKISITYDWRAMEWSVRSLTLRALASLLSSSPRADLFWPLLSLPVIGSPARCRVQEERRMNIQTLPNFLSENIYFRRKLWMFSLEICRYSRSNCEWNSSQSGMENIRKFSSKFVQYRMKSGLGGRFLRRFSLGRNCAAAPRAFVVGAGASEKGNRRQDRGRWAAQEPVSL